MSQGKEIEQALAELAAAHAALEDAARALQQARSEETACMNRVNKAQKEVDDLIASVKAKAPRDTNWGRERNPGFRMPA